MAEDQHNHSKLHSIYAALDTHNYTRALKLSQHKSISTWKITLALRCHILRRIGRKEECVSLLKKQILGYIKVDDPKHDEVSALLLYLRRQKNQLNNNNGAGKNQLVSGKNDGGSSIGLLEEKDALKRLDFPLTKTIMNAELDANGGEVITDEVSISFIDYRTMILSAIFLCRTSFCSFLLNLLTHTIFYHLINVKRRPSLQ